LSKEDTTFSNGTKHIERLEIFTVLKIHVVVFWVVISCSDVVGYKHFGGVCYLHLQDVVSGAWKWP